MQHFNRLKFCFFIKKRSDVAVFCTSVKKNNNCGFIAIKE